MFCPVCNGIQALQENCTSCEGKMSDYGRVSDWTGPYAPYQPMEEGDILSNGLLQSRSDCKHVLICSNCNLTAEVSITEWT